jgi:hypothetical protein
MAMGGGTIWAVRIVATRALGQEAMGFGDVTLMAMIGAFTGWQPTLIIFFLAPFSAVVIAVVQFLLTRRRDIAFGPYLCLSTVVWILHSGPLWKQYGLPIFSLGWWVPGIGAAGLALMGGMLTVMRLLRGGDEDWAAEAGSGGATDQPTDGRQAVTFAAAQQMESDRPIHAGSSRPHPLRSRPVLQPTRAPIPPQIPLSHRPPPPHSRGWLRP